MDLSSLFASSHDNTGTKECNLLCPGRSTQNRKLNTMQRCGSSLLSARAVEDMQAQPAMDAKCRGLVELLCHTIELINALPQAALDDVLQLDNVVARVGLRQQGAEHIGSNEAAN